VCDRFAGLEADNNRDYLAANHDFSEEAVRGQREALLGQLVATFGGEIRMFRQHRDTRFSREQSPYKTNT
jgi:uncharacterized protein (DUF2461 family)